MHRRITLGVAAVLVVVGVVAALVMALADDNGGDGQGDSGTATDSSTASTSPVTPGPSAMVPETAPTTAPPSSTPEGGGPVGVQGSTAVSGALLSEAFDGSPLAGGPPGCTGSGGTFEVDQCMEVAGSGGRFVVATGAVARGGRQARLYARASGGGYAPVARTAEFERDVDVFGLTLRSAEVSGEPVLVVDYDFNGSGAVHSFDVVAWDQGAPAPSVVAFVEGKGMDRVSPGEGTLRFVSANYDDGSPTCCPQQADVRTLRRSGPGSWALTTETVPFAQAP